MKRVFGLFDGSRLRRTLALVGFVVPLGVLAATVDLTTVPLATATNTSVKPNLMFVLDNSGSMEWNYMPDWVTGGNSGSTSYCKHTGGSGSTPGTANAQCEERMPPFYTASFNGAYYNPETTYSPPKGYDGTEKTSYDGNSSVPYDGYGKVSNASLNLKTNYPDYEYCTSNSYSDCVRNDNYLLPATIGSKNYTTRHATTASGTAKFATGTVASPSVTATATAVGPHYYVIVPGEYCSDIKLTTCTASDKPTGSYTYPAKVRWCSNSGLSTCQAVWTTTYKYARYPTIKATSTSSAVPGSFKRFDIVSTVPTYTFANYVHPTSGEIIVNRKSRTDCDKTSPTLANGYSEYVCSYAQELKNFANWFAWYQTRIQMMKTSVSLAFQSIDSQYRVGFYTINNPNTNYLKIDTFKGGAGEQKSLWFNKLLATDSGSGTPLRSSLATVGRIFAGKNPLSQTPTDDPIQYSCQQNFAILTTDGYWNTDGSSDVKTIGGGAIGNMDKTADRPMYEGPTTSSGSLADVAKYYYDTDLRTSAIGNCEGALGAGVDVCLNNVYVSVTDNNIQQHMTTFTLGLGIDGTLQYQKDYKTASSGDFYNIKNGSGAPSNWPVPVKDTATAVDDLWHAAVNGQGTYFSAKNASELSDGLNEALSTIGIRRGAGAAAATSSLNPIAGDNFAYVASYTTVKWIGNLEARTIDLNTGVVSENASWCVEDVLAGACASPSSVVDVGPVSYCSTPGATATSCTSGTFDATAQTCSVQIAKTCTGTLKPMVSATTDTRVIKTSEWTASAGAPLGVSFAVVDFAHGNLSAAQKAYFAETTLTGLSQWSDFTATQKVAAEGANLVNYLRGQTGYEERSANIVDKQLYRYREAVMGDAMESQPVHVGKPKYAYTDDGYSAFVTAQNGRSPTVYIGTNDGMLHAFDANNGKERWAYVPSMVVPNMWKLADKKYGPKHANYVNGSALVADVYDSTSSSWKTILVSGLNGGGRGYFALDITDTTSDPKLLWEIDSSMDADIGYTYGQPLVTKKSDGSWVVLFTSGYNNTNDGVGYLFVRDALTGKAIDKIGTGAGSPTTPSGLSKISGWADDPMKNNLATYVYGGDLLGNIWRFDINATSDKVKKFAVLKDGSGNLQPITTAPELARINNLRVVFVGTGKYLETSDLVYDKKQTIYAITDDDSGTFNNPRASASMVAQVIVASATSGTRMVTTEAVDWITKRGWYADFPDLGERVHVNPVIDGDMLFVATTVPSDTVCAPGGYGWLNYFDYKMSSTGSVLSAVKFDGPIVGINVYYTPDGKRRVSVTTSNNPTPTSAGDIGSGGGPTLFRGRRAIWREIMPTPPKP